MRAAAQSVPGLESYADALRESCSAVGLELGGKDPAYVRADCDLAYTVGELVDGAFFNSGQRCALPSIFDPLRLKLISTFLAVALSSASTCMTASTMSS